MNKKEFQERVAVIKQVSARNLAVLEGPVQREMTQPAYDGLREHDPELARLVEACDYSAVEPLRQLLKYINCRVEN